MSYLKQFEIERSHSLVHLIIEFCIVDDYFAVNNLWTQLLCFDYEGDIRDFHNKSCIFQPRKEYQARNPVLCIPKQRLTGILS